MPPRRLTLVTGNAGKLEEARRIVARCTGDLQLDAVGLDLPEIQSLSLREVLEAKADEAWRRLGRALVVEETGLEVEVFGGFPGPLVKWMLRSMGAEGIARAARGLCRQGEEARVTARCQLLFIDRDPATGGGRVLGEGVEHGTLVLPPRGDRGFGWDPVFLPDGESRTYAELPGEVKDRIGHRGKAWRSLLGEFGVWS